jgi:DNA primase large subunit
MHKSGPCKLRDLCSLVDGPPTELTNVAHWISTLIYSKNDEAARWYMRYMSFLVKAIYWKWPQTCTISAEATDYTFSREEQIYLSCAARPAWRVKFESAISMAKRTKNLGVLHGGFIYFSPASATRAMAELFDRELYTQMASARSRGLPPALHSVASWIRDRFTEENNARMSLVDFDCLPPCMAAIHKELTTGECNIGNQGRVQMTLFLRDSGLSKSQCRSYFESAYARMADGRTRTREYLSTLHWAYNGATGRSYSCHTMSSQVPTKPGYVHGCPLFVKNAKYASDLEDLAGAFDPITSCHRKFGASTCNPTSFRRAGRVQRKPTQVFQARQAMRRGESVVEQPRSRAATVDQVYARIQLC